MRMLSAATVMVLLMAPAYAQTPHVNLIPDVQSKSPEEREQEAIREKAYKDSLRKIPDAKASSDPWGTVRSAETPKTTAPKTAAPTAAPKTAAPAKPKAGSSSQ